MPGVKNSVTVESRSATGNAPAPATCLTVTPMGNLMDGEIAVGVGSVIV